MEPLAIRGVPSGALEAPLALLAEARLLGMLGDLVAFCVRQAPRLAIDEVIIQDEYTHDVVVALPDRRALVFDAT